MTANSKAVLALLLIILSGACSYEESKPGDELAAELPQEPVERASGVQPDILFIAVDDLNDWVGALGGPYQAKTPNIDALAARGMIFKNAHAPGTSCTPTRTALLTGMSPFNSGLYSHEIDWRETPGVSDVETLPRHFREHGYKTIGAGKIFHAHTYSINGAMGQQDINAWDDYFPSLERQLTDEIYPVDSQTDGPARGLGRETGFFDFFPVTSMDQAMGDGQVVSWITDQLQLASDQPQFTAVGIYRPHLPWYVPEKYFDMYPLEEIDLPPYLAEDRNDTAIDIDYNKEYGLGFDAMPPLSDQSTDEAVLAIQAYLASVSFADAMVGELIEGLDRSGRADNTIIVLWSDHGFHFGEKDIWGKFTLWERTTHVPLIIVAPGVTQPGSSSEEAVSLQQIYPTLSDLAGLSLPKHVDGRSLRPLLEEPDSTWDEVAITVSAFGSYTVRDDNHRYIVYTEGGEELYDLSVDPNEWRNIVDDPVYSETLDRLRGSLPPLDQQKRPPADADAEE